MSLSEKIFDLRKKAGLSQEALAEKLGVSRQAVSKWETGEAIPDVSKIILLAELFAVTTDYLLKDGKAPEPTVSAGKTASSYPDWLDRLPGWLGQLFRRFGWLIGVYIALGGAGFTLVGVLARVMGAKMYSGLESFGSLGGLSGFDGMSGFSTDYGITGLEQFTTPHDNMFTGFSNVFVVLGILLILAGTVLAIALYRWGKKKHE